MGRRVAARRSGPRHDLAVARRGGRTTQAMERLQRVLAARGVASRRAAEDLITAGRVSVNGEVVTELGTKVPPDVRIRVDGQLLRPQKLRYIILNKPRSYITTMHDERNRRTVMDLVQVPERVYPVGRLDRQTEGLLLLTNDGEVANRVMHPRYGLAKEYNVLTPTQPSDERMRRVRAGVTVEGRTIVPSEFRVLRQTAEGVLLKIVIHEGLYHVVRRIMEAVGIRVERLRRVRIGPLSIAGLAPGEWRELTNGEVAQLFEALHIEREPPVATGHRPQPRRAGAPPRGTGPVGLALESDEWEGGPVPPGRPALPRGPRQAQPSAPRRGQRPAARRSSPEPGETPTRGAAARRGLPGSTALPSRSRA